MSNKVVISGGELSLPYIKNCDSVFDFLKSKKRVLSDKYLDREELIDFYNLNKNPDIIKVKDTGKEMYGKIKKLIDDALNNAGITKEEIKNNRTNIYISGQGLRADLSNFQGFYDKNDIEDVNYTPSIKKLHSIEYSQDMLSKNLFDDYHLEWPPITLYNASNSALMAVNIGFNDIKENNFDIVIIVSWTDVLLQDIAFMDNQNMLASIFSQPFSKYSDGVILSDGYAVLILENMSLAKKRNKKNFIVINSIVFNQNFSIRNIGGYSFNFSTISKTILSALEFANYSPRQIGAIFIHGNGSINSDKSEEMAILNVFNEMTDIPILSYKGQIGYVSNCSGIIDLMIIAKSLQENSLIPSTSNCYLNDQSNLNFLSDEDVVNYDRSPVLKIGLGMDGSIIAMVLNYE